MNIYLYAFDYQCEYRTSSKSVKFICATGYLITQGDPNVEYPEIFRQVFQHFN